MSMKLFEAFSSFDYITSLFVENLDQKISKLLQNKGIKDFITQKRSGDVDRQQMTDEMYVRRIANIFDPTPDKKFLEYVIKNWMEGNINGDEDAPQVKSALTKYVSLTARNTPNLSKDINAYRNIADLYKTITQLSPATPADTYKERIETFLKAAKESKQKVVKVLDLPEGYHLYSVQSGPKKEENIFQKSDICQGYWCIKQPYMGHYYPLFFLEKNGFIEIAIVPKAGEIKNPYNKAEYTDSQVNALDYLFNNWEEIDKKLGGDYFNPKNLEGDFANYALASSIKKSVNFEKINLEITEAMDKYNTVATVPKIPSIEAIKLPEETRGRSIYFQGPAEQTVKDVGIKILKHVKSIYNNLSLKDKFKYHFFFINIVSYIHIYFGSLSLVSANGIELNSETPYNTSFVYEPFLPPNSLNSLKQLSELYYKNFNLYKTNLDTQILRSSNSNAILEFIKVTMTTMFKYMITCNALLKLKGADVFTFNENQKGSNIISFLEGLQRIEKSNLDIFTGNTSYLYMEDISEQEISAHMIGAFNNFDNTLETTKYFSDESIQDKIKEVKSKLQLKTPNQDIIDSKNGYFNKTYIIPELEALVPDFLSEFQQGGVRPRAYYYINNPNSKYFYDKIKGEEDAPAPKFYRSVAKGGISEITDAYKNAKTIDVNNLLAVNYLINLDIHPRSSEHQLFTQTKQGVEHAENIKITGNIIPNIGNKVYSRFYETFNDFQGDLKFFKAGDIRPENPINNPLYLNAFYNPQDPSSILIGRFSAGLISTKNMEKRDSNIFKERPYTIRSGRRNFDYATSIDTDQILYTYTLFKKLYDQYEGSFYPNNQSSLSRVAYTIYNILVSKPEPYRTQGLTIHKDKEVDLSSIDREFLWKLFLESFFDLKGEEKQLLLVNQGFIESFYTNSFINKKLKSNEALQQKIFNFIKDDNTDLLKAFYINTGGIVNKAPENIEQALNLMDVSRYKKAAAKTKGKGKITLKDLPKDPNYVKKIGKYTLGKDFQEGIIFDQPWEEIGIDMLSGPTNDNLTVIKNGVKDLKWTTIIKFINKFSEGFSYIINGTVKDQETGELLPIVYYRKETTPGAGQSLIYLPQHYYHVSQIKSLIKHEKGMYCSNGMLTGNQRYQP